MKILVTGAGGYIGSALVGLLQERQAAHALQMKALCLVDRQIGEVPAGARALVGDIASVELLSAIGSFAPDVTFHLAAVPGGAAERDPALGRRVNLDATLALFETLAASGGNGRAPVVIYASSIAVYGTSLPDPVGPDTPLRPAITYGAHKAACEILLADFTRRGWLDGRSLRLPGIVARPRTPSGLSSAFMSDLLHALAAAERFTCPVGAQATAWWMSARRCAENLLHACAMDLRAADSRRAWPLPVLRLSMQEVVDTLARLYGADRAALVRYEPDARLEEVFGRYPQLDDSTARALGLRDDGSAEALVRRALAGRFED